MTVSIFYTPLKADNPLKDGKAELWVKVKYTMFQELVGEFSRADWPVEKFYNVLQVEREVDSKQQTKGAKKYQYEYRQEIEFPYGSTEFTWYVVPPNQKPTDNDEDNKLLHNIEPNYMENLSVKTLPVPKSMEQLAAEHAQEETQNKMNEQQARQA
jgi:hypothetical protein